MPSGGETMSSGLNDNNSINIEKPKVELCAWKSNARTVNLIVLWVCHPWPQRIRLDNSIIDCRDSILPHLFMHRYIYNDNHYHWCYPTPTFKLPTHQSPPFRKHRRSGSSTHKGVSGTTMASCGGVGYQNGKIVPKVQKGNGRIRSSLGQDWFAPAPTIRRRLHHLRRSLNLLWISYYLLSSFFGVYCNPQIKHSRICISPLTIYCKHTESPLVDFPPDDFHAPILLRDPL